MTEPTLPAILADIECQNDALVAAEQAVRTGLDDARALYADKAKMDAFVAAHDARKAILAPLEAWLDAEVRRQLSHAIASGTLRPMSGGISTPFIDRWNSVLAGKKAAFLMDDVVETFVDLLRRSIGFSGAKDDVRLGAEAIQAMLDTGTVATPSVCGNNGMLADFWSGGTFLLTLDAWQPTIHTSVGKGKGTRVATPRPDTTMYHASVEFPTGRVLVADRLPFQATETIIDKVGDSFNVNYGLHRLMRSAMLMGLHNIVQISVGNTDPHVQIHNGHIAVGRADALDTNAQICTDLWMGTMIDVGTLHALGVTDADIAQAIADDEVEELALNPGTWHVFWSEEAAQEATAERFASLYPHTADDRLAFWMTQDLVPVAGLKTVQIMDARLGTKT